MATTTIQPDTVAWYPMRVTYQRVLSVKEVLDAKHIENFLPLQWELRDLPNGQRRYEHTPLIKSIIFVRESVNNLTELKRLPSLEPLRFYTRPYGVNHEKREIFPVPDKQMDDFIRLTSSSDERVVFLQDSDYLSAVSQRVRITEGEFAGVEGVVKRIKNNKCVVVRIEGLAAVAILRCPVSTLQKID